MAKPLLTELPAAEAPTLHFPETSGAQAPEREEIPPPLRRDAPPPLRPLDEATLRAHFADVASLPQPAWPGAAVASRAAELPGLCALHPAQPAPTAQGALEIIHEVARALASLTGLERFCLQPASLAAAERAALLIAKAAAARTESPRNEVVAPADSSALPLAADVGLVPRPVPRLASGNADVEAVEAAVGPATLIVAAPWLTPADAFERNLGAIGHVAHARGAFFGVDATGLCRFAGRARPREAEADVVWLSLAELCPTAHGAALGVRSALGALLPSPLVGKDRSGYVLDDELPSSIGPLAVAAGRLLDALAVHIALRTLGEAGLRERGARLTAEALARRGCSVYP